MLQVAKISQDSTASAQLISLSYNLYAFGYSVRRIVGKIGTLLVLIVLAVPAMAFAIPFVRWLIYRLKKSIIKSTVEFDVQEMTAEEYRRTRLALDKITSNIEVIERIKNVKLDNKPWIVHGLIRDYKGILDALLDSHRKVEASLKQLDTPVNSSIFTPLSGDDLWNKRNKAAEYIM